MKTYIVTGGCGFIGSYVIQELLKQEDVFIYNIDKMGVGSSKENIVDDPRVENHVIDIANDEHWRMHMTNPLAWISKEIDYVIHLAAESHVDRSIDNPLSFVDSNIVGTAKILEMVRKQKARMVHVSTDEVYGHLARQDPPFTEDSPLKPRSPYSASKASSDLLVESYINTYNIRATITRCCNNYGPRQHSEKLIPTVLNSIFTGKKIPVYGTGENIREWIHAEDHAKAIIEILHNDNYIGEVRNLCGSKVLSNISLVTQLIEEVEAMNAVASVNFGYPDFRRERQGAMMEYIEFVKDRKGHDFKYELSTIHTDELNSIKDQRPFDLSDTIHYYASKFTAC